ARRTGSPWRSAGSAEWPWSGPAAGWARYASRLHFHIGAGRRFDRLQRPDLGITRRDLRAGPGVQPVGPVRPPAAGMLFRPRLPFLKRFGKGGVDPVLILLGRGRVDDPGDMARSGQRIGHRPAEQPRRAVNRVHRRDVVLAAGLEIEGDADLRQVDALAVDLQLAPG